jgi:hypothetical protein
MIETNQHMKNYNIHLNENQLQVLVNALDLYSRIGIGQLEEVEMIYRLDGRKKQVDRNYDTDESTEIDFDHLHQILNLAKQELGHGQGSHYGIYSKEVPDAFRVAWDIMKVVRHQLAIDRCPTGGFGVDFDIPQQSGKEPLPIISIEK